MPPRRVRAALFDMDGTILDIEPLSTQAINQQCAPAASLCRNHTKTSLIVASRRSVEPLGGHVDLALKRLILGKRAAEWTRIVIGAPSVVGCARSFAGLRSACC